MHRPIRVAVFGNGFARSVVLPCLRHVDGARIVGISSPSLERVRATAADFGIERAAATHTEILESCRPDLVFIATPPHRHLEMSLDALRAGCHVVCEKPTALSADESRAMRDAARDAPGQLALIDHELRFLPSRTALREWVARGRLGRILRADYVLCSPGRRDPALPWSWWSDRARGGGALGAIGSHAVDALRVLLGEIVEASGILETFVRERVDPADGAARAVTSDDFAAAWLRFGSGAIATVTISAVEAFRAHRLIVTGTNGSAEVEEHGPLRVAIGSGAWSEVPASDDLPSSSSLGIPDTDWARAFLRFAREIVAAAREERTDVPGAATFEDGHRVQVVLDAIRRSADTGTRLQLAD